MMVHEIRQRIGIIFLSLFVSLIAMMSLHGVCEQDRRCVQASSTLVKGHHLAEQIDKSECPICHFLHTPFLAKVILPDVSFIALGVALLWCAVRASAQSSAPLSLLLRGPPTH